MFCLQSVEFASLVGKLLFKRRKRRLCQRAPPQPGDGGANGQRSECNQDFSHATNRFLCQFPARYSATVDSSVGASRTGGRFSLRRISRSQTRVTRPLKSAKG